MIAFKNFMKPFRTPNKKLEDSILEFSSRIDRKFKKYEHLYIFWDSRDFCYATANYIYSHKTVAWGKEVHTPWVVEPRTVENTSIAMRDMHHGLHPKDWIVLDSPNTKSLPPERLKKDILIELEAHLLSEGLCKIKTDLKTHVGHIVKPEPIEPIDSRFDILDL